MPLSANARLGPYEIRSALGAGGMGEVYSAFDSRLNRTVAIKILHLGDAGSPESRSRFEREAHALAALNHPNIVSVYDFGMEAEQPYIVSELVEGSSLRSLLTGKPTPLRKLLDIAAQVADGLAAAHAGGFVHRDLKPENIMLAKDGRVKVVDFGLARQDGKGNRSDSDAATLTAVAHRAEDGATKAGVVLGTPRYMSPEQALGKPADFRSDQFSLGLILYELASGKQAFAQQSNVETMAAIVREEPPPLDDKLPAPLRWIIDRCLHKEPEQRYESTRDLYQELRNLRDHLSEASTGALAPVPPIQRRRWRIAVPAVICILLAGFIGLLLRPVGQDIGNYRDTPFATDTGRAVWSPDGKAVAYASKVNGTDQVFLRYLNATVPIQLTHEKLDTEPLGWSSDRSHLIVEVLLGLSVTMFDRVKVYSVPTVGGRMEYILDADCYTSDLSRDGRVFAALSYPDVEISDPIGSPLRPYKPSPFNASVARIHSIPGLSFSPDGRQILLLLPVTGEPGEAWLLPYPPGSGSPYPISIFSKLPFTSIPSASWMPDSRDVVLSVPRDMTSPHHLWMTSTSSNELMPLTTGTSDERGPEVSPDGRSILYSQVTQRSDVISVSVEDGTTKTLITTGRLETDPAWSANQAKLAWVSTRRGPWEIWVRSPDGSDRPAVTPVDFPSGSLFVQRPSLSPDGERIIYQGSGVGENGLRLWMSSLSGGAPIQLTNSPNAREYTGSWSPDGSQFVYMEKDGNTSNLMTVRTSGNAAPTIVKRDVSGHALPVWSPSGEWILYLDKDGWQLISPDGKTSKSLGKLDTPSLAFSRDGRILYGIDVGERALFPVRATLFSFDPATLQRKVIKELGKELAPQSENTPGTPFSMAPDGKSFVYPTIYFREDLWMLTGYRQPGWRARILGALGLK
jgi:eukaryotic-like serine/threonine-protein kinase